jgi:hypothetical protein
MRIYKYQLHIESRMVYKLPAPAEILHVGTQCGVPQMWVMVDPGSRMIDRIIHVIGTGHKMPKDTAFKYLDTIKLYGETLIFHVFEEIHND